MRYKRIRSIIMAGVLGMLNVLFAYSQPADSLPILRTRLLSGTGGT